MTWLNSQPEKKKNSQPDPPNIHTLSSQLLGDGIFAVLFTASKPESGTQQSLLNKQMLQTLIFC